MDAVTPPSAGGDDLRQAPPPTPNGEPSKPAVTKTIPLRALAPVLAAIILFFAPGFMLEFWGTVEAAQPFFDADYWTGVGFYLLLSIIAVAIIYLTVVPKRVFKTLLIVILLNPLISGLLFIALKALDAHTSSGFLFVGNLCQSMIAVALVFELIRANYKIHAPKFQFRWFAIFATVGIGIGTFAIAVTIQCLIWGCYQDINIEGIFEFVLFFTAICLFTPVAEELIFRRVFMGGLIAAAPRTRSYLIAIVLAVSLVFTGLHSVNLTGPSMEPFQLALLIPAIGFAVIYLWWGIRYSILIHALYNGLVLLLILLADFGVLDSLLGSYIQSDPTILLRVAQYYQILA